MTAFHSNQTFKSLHPYQVRKRRCTCVAAKQVQCTADGTSLQTAWARAKQSSRGTSSVSAGVQSSTRSEICPLVCQHVLVDTGVFYFSISHATHSPAVVVMCFCLNKYHLNWYNMHATGLGALHENEEIEKHCTAHEAWHAGEQQEGTVKTKWWFQRQVLHN